MRDLYDEFIIKLDEELQGVNYQEQVLEIVKALNNNVDDLINDILKAE
jgi:hypothetical protein